MKALHVFLNGKQVCIAAPYGDDRLYAEVEIGSEIDESGRNDDLCVRGRQENQVATWAYKELGIGDEIVIRVVDAQSLSQPVRFDPVLPQNRR